MLYHATGTTSGGSKPRLCLNGSDGVLYGFVDGGYYGAGALFRLIRDGSAYNILHYFGYFPPFLDGQYPVGSLLETVDGKLYGATSNGGSNTAGTVFKVNKDGTDYGLLYQFSTSGKTEAANPSGGVLEITNGILYGLTSSGGIQNYGTMYKMNLDGSGHAVVCRFGSSEGDGHYPVNELTQGNDGALYGVTTGGGTSGLGTAFKVNPDGSAYRILRNFSRSGGDGYNPWGSVTEGHDGVLYGTTADGGSWTNGTVYTLKKDGSGYSVLKHFSTYDADGRSPRAGLTEGADSALYGTTELGGSSGAGTVFKLGKDGNGYTILHHFDGSDGRNPRGGLLSTSDGTLYGTTFGGGSNNSGVVFRLNNDAGSFAVLHYFSNGAGDGRYPSAALIEGRDGALYGTAEAGGSGGYGIVFKLSEDGSLYSILHHFNTVSGDGQYPLAPLVEGSDDALYGTTDSGGKYNAGTVFRLNKDGTGYLILLHFGAAAGDGRQPDGALVESPDGALYGTTYGGGANYNGTIFKLGKNGTGYNTVHSFSAREGIGPMASLVKGRNGALYGTAVGGGDLGFGTIFQYMLPQTPEMLGASVVGTTVRIRFAGQAGYEYSLLSSTNMTDWSIFTTITMPSSGVSTNIDTSPPPGWAFYRAIWTGQ